MSDTQQERGTHHSQQKPGSWRKPLLGALVVLVIGAAGGLGVWYLLYGKAEPPSPAAGPQPVTAEPAPAAEPAAEPGSAQHTLSLPDSDSRVRELVGRLSSQPELAAWLRDVDDLIRRFSTAVSNIAEGESPRASLSFLAPRGGFQVVEREGRLFIDPKSHARYDAVARVFGSLDSQGAAAAWRELKPLIDRAHAEISRPGQRFEQTLARAIQHLLEVPVPEAEVEVVDTPGVNYACADPALEKLSAAQKHLLRMGPANARAIQSKLRELQGALALPTASR